MPTSPSSKKIIGITIGDPGGIGPEVIIKSLQTPSLQRHLARHTSSNVFFVCIGSQSVLEKNIKMTNSSLPLNLIASIDADRLRSDALNVVEAGKGEDYEVAAIAVPNARLALDAVEKGARLAKYKKINALVTAPINKEACQLLRPGFTGHTEFLAAIDGTKSFAMMLCGKMLRVVLVTTHVPLAHVAQKITQKAIVEKIILTNDYLCDRIKIASPRIGVAGLNPHAGEGGKIGREEIEHIIPAIEETLKMNINVTGPYPPDVIFHKAYNEQLDAVVAMYHDQGLAPLKMIAFETGINVTLGLSFVRTSPDHGTAFDIAYLNKACPDSMRNAIEHAIAMSG
jgi:4-phospho-D-threonate 3-dehydrogenase / 4-phospho-D-erythronate 3-dehydrogenase